MRDKCVTDFVKHKTPFNRERKNHNLIIKKHNIMFNGCLVLISLTAISAIILASVPTTVFADDSAISTATVVISSSCSLTANVDSVHTANLANGVYSGGADLYPNGIGKTTITAFCNNAAGFAIYAVGYSGSPGTYGNNYMVGAATGMLIPSGTATAGNTSQWAMKVNKVDDSTAYNPENLTITNNFDDYHIVPTEYEKVADFSSNTDATLGSKMTATYAVYASPTQSADAYVGQVKYTLVHPQAVVAPSILNEYGIVYMQDFAKLTPGELDTIKSAMLPDEKVMLKDNRDGSVYNIAKLKDGNIWLLDNLALDLTSRTVADGLSSNNTNATDLSLNYLRKGGGTASDRYPIAGLSYTNWTSGYSYSQPMVNTSQKDTTNTGDALSNDAKTWKYGFYYNYCAASAGSYCYGNGTSTSATLGDATEDLCPKGWRMPIGGNNGDYHNLNSDSYGYTSVNLYRTALRLPLSGYVRTGVVSDSTERGNWWGLSGGDYVANLNVTASSIDPTGNMTANRGRREDGHSVRCILDTTNKKTIADVEYMQDVTSELINNTPPNTTTVLLDRRDNVSYTVGKLNDGNLWMLDNLALDLTSHTVVNALSSVNTNATDVSLNYLKNGGGTASDRYAILPLTYTDAAGYYSFSTPLVNTAYKNTTFAEDTLAGATNWKYGVYYNFCAVSAGSYCFGNGTNSGNPSGSATEDICPKNWKLPSGSGNGLYQQLYADRYTYNSINAYRTALHLPLSGRLDGGAIVGQGSYGFWWSSTYSDHNNMYSLYISPSEINFTEIWYRGRNSKHTVRCVFNLNI